MESGVSSRPDTEPSSQVVDPQRRSQDVEVQLQKTKITDIERRAEKIFRKVDALIAAKSLPKPKKQTPAIEQEEVLAERKKAKSDVDQKDSDVDVVPDPVKEWNIHYKSSFEEYFQNVQSRQSLAQEEPERAPAVVSVLPPITADLLHTPPADKNQEHGAPNHSKPESVKNKARTDLEETFILKPRSTAEVPEVNLSCTDLGFTHDRRATELDRRIKVYVLGAFKTYGVPIQMLLAEKLAKYREDFSKMFCDEDYLKVIQLYQKIRTLFPLTENDLYVLAQCFYNLKDYGRALLLFTDVLILGDYKTDCTLECAECLFQIASNLRQEVRIAEAINHFLRSISVAPENLEYRLALISCYVEASRYDEAGALADMTMKLFGNDKALASRVHYNLAQIDLRTDRYPEMYHRLDVALENDPANKEARALTQWLRDEVESLRIEARKLFVLQHYKTAEKKVNEILRHKPNYLEVLLLKSAILRKQSKLRDCLTVLRSIFENRTALCAASFRAIREQTGLLYNAWAVDALRSGDASTSLAWIAKATDLNVTADNNALTMTLNHARALEDRGLPERARSKYRIAEGFLNQTVGPGAALLTRGLKRQIHEGLCRTNLEYYRTRLQQQHWRRKIRKHS